MSFYLILLIILALIYLISPIDFIPDFFGLPGRIDDLIALIFTIWYVNKLSRKYQSKMPGAGRGEEKQSETGTPRKQREEEIDEEEKDPFRVLGVQKGASFEEVTRAYRKLMTQYHPDKVSHLGKEFQEIAERKTKQLNKAYQEIKRYYSI